MTPQELSLLLLSVVSGSLGQLLLKLGALKLGKVTFDNLFSHIFNIVLIPELLAGIVAYALAALAYILLLTRVNISVAAPCAALIYIFSILYGFFYLKEAISLTQGIGMGLIVCGVVLVIAR
ncbi:MAG: EamA family transporter [Leptolyngbya sp. SIO4C1]|nr:EamA family transporter [Leptolyngbya sp. SIO4C1]